MTVKVVWHTTIQSGKHEELARVLREDVGPGLARDPDFVGVRVFRRIFGPDLGRQIELEYRSYDKAARMSIEPDNFKLLVPRVVSLLTSNRAELVMEEGAAESVD